MKRKCQFVIYPRLPPKYTLVQTLQQVSNPLLCMMTSQECGLKSLPQVFGKPVYLQRVSHRQKSDISTESIDHALEKFSMLPPTIWR
ncbi:hypothetical protein DNTS_018066, partial [Danionella cerebrum]